MLTVEAVLTTTVSHIMELTVEVTVTSFVLGFGVNAGQNAGANADLERFVGIARHQGIQARKWSRRRTLHDHIRSGGVCAGGNTAGNNSLSFGSWDIVRNAGSIDRWSAEVEFSMYVLVPT